MSYGADFQIGVDNRDYHYLSQSEIDGAKGISRHLSNFREKSSDDTSGKSLADARIVCSFFFANWNGLFEARNFGS